MLTFNLKKEWFEKIKSGEKTHEYREVKHFWTIRLVNYFDLSSNDIEKTKTDKLYLENNLLITFVRGYTNEILLARVISIRQINGLKTDLKVNRLVYDIEFELIKEVNDEI